MTPSSSPTFPTTYTTFTPTITTHTSSVCGEAYVDYEEPLQGHAKYGQDAGKCEVWESCKTSWAWSCAKLKFSQVKLSWIKLSWIKLCWIKLSYVMLS